MSESTTAEKMLDFAEAIKELPKYRPSEPEEVMAFAGKASSVFNALVAENYLLHLQVKKLAQENAALLAWEQKHPTA